MATKTPKAPRGSKAQPLPDRFAGAPTVNIQADYRFTDDELQALGLKLAGLIQEKEEIAAHKKDQMAQLKAQEERVIADIKGTSNKRRSGFETRATDALVLFSPKEGKKFFHRVSDKTLIREEQMMPSDYERELPMVVPPAGKKGVVEALVDAVVTVATGKDKKKGAPTTSSPAGETSLGDALKAAAAGKVLEPVPITLSVGFPAEKSRGEFRKAAKKAGWPEVCVDLIDDEAKKAAASVEDEPEAGIRARQVLAPHTEGGVLEGK